MSVYIILFSLQAISFFCMVMFIILAAYMLAFIFNKWNKKVIVYTLKDAVLG
jgi:uncharacterized membrane protein